MSIPSALATINELAEVLQAFRACAPEVEDTGKLIIDGLKKGNKVLTCGNGGSASDAMHMTEELVGRYRGNRAALPGIALTADGTALTCIVNDFGYDAVFSRQVEALGRPGDVLVGFSTSGNSQNILRALHIAKDMGLLSILLTGKDGGQCKAIADRAIIVPSGNTARIQEIHTLILHHWLEMVEGQQWD